MEADMENLSLPLPPTVDSDFSRLYSIQPHLHDDSARFQIQSFSSFQREMLNLRMKFSASCRTTHTDIMCTTNTFTTFILAKSNAPDPIAKMPFVKAKTLQTPISLRAATLMQKLKVVENKNKRHFTLLSERDSYLQKLRDEEISVMYLRNKAATRIQTIYRGHRCRPMKFRRFPYLPRRKSVKRVFQSELHESLCEMAHKLHLKPIAGLNLESKAKTVKRKAKIESAAVCRIVNFFRMITAKSKAKKVMAEMVKDRIDQAARVVTRFFRYIKMRKWTKNLEKENQMHAATIMQRGFRCFAARKKLRVVRAAVVQHRREKEAVIKIQRTVSPFKVRHKQEQDRQRTERLGTKISTMVWEDICEQCVFDVCAFLGEEEADKERAAIAEAKRQAECSTMFSEEMWMVEHLRLCENVSETVLVNYMQEYVDNEVDTSFEYAYMEHLRYLEMQRQAREAVLMSAEESRTREFDRALMLAHLLRMDKISTECIGIVVDTVSEDLIVQIATHSALVEVMREHMEDVRLSVSSDEAKKFVQTVCSRALEARLAVLCPGLTQAAKAVSSKAIPKEAAPFKVDKVADELPAKVVSVSTKSQESNPAKAASTSTRSRDSSPPRVVSTSTASTRPRESSPPRVAPISTKEPSNIIAIMEADSNVEIKQVFSPRAPTTPADNRRPSEILRDTAKAFVESLWNKQDRKGGNASTKAPTVQDDTTAKMISTDAVVNAPSDNKVPVDVPVQDDELSVESKPLERSVTESAVELSLNQISVEVETALYEAKYEETLRHVENMRVCVLTHKDSNELSECKFNYYLTYSHLLMAECMVEIADYPEALALLEVVCLCEEFMQTDISRSIVEEALPLTIEYNSRGQASSLEGSAPSVRNPNDPRLNPMAGSSAGSVSSLGSTVCVEIDVERKARVYVALANVAKAYAQYQCMESNLEKAIMLMNDAEYDGPLRVQVSLILSQGYFEQGRYADCAMTLTSVRTNIGSVCSPTDVIFASIMDDILFVEAQFLVIRGLSTQAEQLFNSVIQGRREYLAPGHPKIASVEMELGHLCHLKNDFASAQELIDSALSKFVKSFAICGGEEAVRLVAQSEYHRRSSGYLSSIIEDNMSEVSAGSYGIDRTNSPSLENTLEAMSTREQSRPINAIPDASTKGFQSSKEFQISTKEPTAAAMPVSNMPINEVIEILTDLIEDKTRAAAPTSTDAAQLYQFLALKHPLVATAVLHKANLQCTLGLYMCAERNAICALNGRKQMFTLLHTHSQTLALLQHEQTIHALKQANMPLSRAQLVQSNMQQLKAPNNGNHPAIAQALCGLATVLAHMFICKDSLDLHEQALAMRRACIQSDTHVDIAESILRIAQAFFMAGKYSQACVAFEHSLALSNELMCELDVNVCESNEVNKIWLASLYAALNRFDDAQIILGESGKRICGLVGNKHIHVAEGLFALGELITLKARYADAKKLLQRAHDMLVKLVSPHHPLVSHVQCLLAENYRACGYFNEANDMCTDALNTRLHIFGSKNLYFARALCVRANILRDVDNLEESEQCYSNALKVVKNSVGEESAFFCYILGEVGECLRKLGHLDNARIVVTKSIEFKKQLYGETHMSVFESIVVQTLVEMDKNDVTNYQNALYVLNEVVLPNLVPICGNAHPLVHYTKANIGLCMNAIAILFLEKGMIGRLEAMVGKGHPLLARAQKKLVGGQVGEDEPMAAEELPGQQYIDTAIDELEKFPQMPFTSAHPWLKRFGV